jgi:hypothetical protein
MKNRAKNLHLIFTYLLAEGKVSAKLLQELEKLAADPKAEELLEQVELLFFQQDDPAWIEAIAAASEGVTTPAVADFEANREILAQLEPELVERFDLLLNDTPPDDTPPLPAFPTFAKQFQAVTKPPAWPQEAGFVWQYIEKKGKLIIRFFEESLFETPTPPQMAQAGGMLKSRGGHEAKHTLNNIEDLDVTVTVRQKRGQSNFYTVQVNVDVHSQDPTHLAGSQVVLKQAKLGTKKGVTDNSGMAKFEDIRREQLPGLTVEIIPFTELNGVEGQNGG